MLLFIGFSIFLLFESSRHLGRQKSQEYEVPQTYFYKVYAHKFWYLLIDFYWFLMILVVWKGDRFSYTKIEIVKSIWSRVLNAKKGGPKIAKILKKVKIMIEIQLAKKPKV